MKTKKRNTNRKGISTRRYNRQELAIIRKHIKLADRNTQGLRDVMAIAQREIFTSLGIQRSIDGLIYKANVMPKGWNPLKGKPRVKKQSVVKDKVAFKETTHATEPQVKLVDIEAIFSKKGVYDESPLAPEDEKITLKIELPKWLLADIVSNHLTNKQKL